MADIPLRSMSVGQVLDGAFTIYRRHFGVMVGITALLYGPMAVTFSALYGWMVLSTTEEADPGALILLGGLFVLLSVLWLLAYAVAEGALTQAVSDLVLEGRTAILHACRAALRRILPLLGATLLKWLVIGLSAVVALAALIPFAVAMAITGTESTAMGVAMVVVGVLSVTTLTSIVFAMLFGVTPAIILEHAGVSRSLVRSSRLAKGSWIRILAVLFLAILIGTVLVGGGSILATLFVLDPTLSLVLYQVAQQLLGLLFAPYYAICVVLLYYDARIRREAFDLERLASELPAAPESP